MKKEENFLNDVKASEMYESISIYCILVFCSIGILIHIIKYILVDSELFESFTNGADFALIILIIGVFIFGGYSILKKREKFETETLPLLEFANATVFEKENEPYISQFVHEKLIIYHHNLRVKKNNDIIALVIRSFVLLIISLLFGYESFINNISSIDLLLCIYYVICLICFAWNDISKVIDKYQSSSLEFFYTIDNYIDKYNAEEIVYQKAVEFKERKNHIN